MTQIPSEVLLWFLGEHPFLDYGNPGPHQKPCRQKECHFPQRIATQFEAIHYLRQRARHSLHTTQERCCNSRLPSCTSKGIPSWLCSARYLRMSLTCRIPQASYWRPLLPVRSAQPGRLSALL